MLQDCLLKKLLIGQMAVQGLSTATIEFFRSVYEIVSAEKGAGCPEMGRVAHLSRQNANLYAQKLVKAGYFERVSYRSWQISKNAMTDPDFLSLLKKTERVVVDPDLAFLVMSAGGVAA